jgi:hypothetical protein
VSQDQKVRVEQILDSTPSDTEVTQQTNETTGAQQATGPVGKKRVRRKTRLVNVEEIMPRPSLFPLILALSLAFVLFGVMVHPIMIGIGTLLVIASIVGWIVERR